jgi:hypothetical protein
VLAESVTVQPAFQVLGFSARGRVVDRAGNGVSGAAVNVNGVDKATTGACLCLLARACLQILC